MNDLLFRNVNVTETDPVETWPFEAVLAAVERGSLRQWRRLVIAVREHPWGTVARNLEQALDVSQPYGVEPGLHRALTAARREREQAEKAQVASTLRELVVRSGRPANVCASLLGTSASRLSTYLTGKVTPSATFMVRAHRTLSPARNRFL